MKKKLLTGGLATLALAFAIIQFIPSQPVIVPAQLPAAEREAHRLLNFEGIANFRDLGGYRTQDGRTVRWGSLYRSGHHALATASDQATVSELGLVQLVDLRSSFEKEQEPDRLPEPRTFEVVELPILDEGNLSMVRELTRRIETGELDDFDPDQVMITANRQFASQFSAQYRQFMHLLLDANGQPVLWHCTAGKDRAGFASAIVLRTLGVPEDTVIADYMLSREQAVAARSRDLWLLKVFKGSDAADKVRKLLGVDSHWLRAAFEQIEQDWGNFDNYRRQALGLSDADVARLQDALLQ